METDPIFIARSYVDKMASKIAFHNAMTPKNDTSMEQLYKKMRKDGMSKEDVDLVKQYHLSITNQLPPGVIVQGTRPFISWAYTFGTVMLLGRAVFSSISEPMNVAMKTGRLSDAMRYYKYTLDQLVKTQDAQAMREASRFIGLVAQDMVDQSIDARLGGGLQLGVGHRNILSKFFRKTLLTPLTNHQREVVLRISYRYLQAMTEKLGDKSVKTVTKNQIKRELAEYGIPQDEMASFAKWLQDQNGFPSLQELDTPYGRMFLTAVWRFNKSTIQDPKREDKPYFASTPVGSILYAVTSYSFAYWENIVKAQGKKFASTRAIDGNVEGVKFAGNMLVGFSALYAATFLVQAARLAMFDHEKWEEMDEEDKLMEFLVRRARDYTGITGPVLSFLSNAAEGLKYQRDLATSLSGAHLSSYFDFIQKTNTLLGENNSPNTNTAEYNFVKSAFRTIVGPAIAIGLAVLPGGALLGTAEGAGIMAITSNSAADTAAKVIVGEKTENGGGNGDKEAKEAKESD
jgi:hypothetical protein